MERKSLSDVKSATVVLRECYGGRHETQCILKSDIAAQMSISMSTLRRYLHAVEGQLPHYQRTQKMLTPDQHAVFRRHYCLVEDE